MAITEVSTRFNLIPWYCLTMLYSVILLYLRGFIFHFYNILGWKLAETHTNSVMALWYHKTIELL